MARAWVTDRWTKDAEVTLPDGTVQKLSPTSEQLKALRSLPEYFRTAKYGKGSRWAVRWYEPTSTSARRQRELLFKRRTEAEQYAAELEDDIRSGRYIDPSDREKPFREVAEKWLESKQRIKDSTHRRYRRELDNYVLPMWGSFAIGEIRTEKIREWVQQLVDGDAPFEFSKSAKVSPNRRRPGKMKPSYIEHLVGSTFGGAIRFSVDSRWIGENPLRGVELPRDEGNLEADLPTLSYDDVEALADDALELTERTTDKVLLHMLAYSAPRIGEATALKIKDLDLPNKQARVHRTWTVDREGNRKLGSVKNWQKRWLPLTDFVCEELAQLTQGRGPEDFVFVTVRGDAVNDRNWYNRVWIKVRARTGLATSFSVHDLRHVAATLAIAAGADVKLVQQMLGHKDATETLNTYGHLWPNKVGEVISLVEKRRKKALKAAKKRAKQLEQEAAASAAETAA